MSGWPLQPPTALEYFATLVAGDVGPALLEAAVLVAQDACPALDAQAVLCDIDALGERLARRIPADAAPMQRLRQLNRFFFDELGFQGKSAIHPDQVPVINRTFRPSADEVAYAQKVVDAFAQAAQQIKSIVSRSTADIETGSSLAAQAGHKVAGTVGIAGSVAGTLAGVLDASRQQRERIGDLHATLSRLSTDTQGNAALVEQIAAATGSLDGSGRELREVVGRFRIGQRV